MKSRNGTDYSQNYDVIVKWLADALCGETLEVLGVKTGRIEEVFGFEPVEIAVRAGRADVMARDETGALYHIEEQRNLRKADMYRFAAYHFLAAGQFGCTQITDVILASGDVYKGDKVINTESGTYKPVVIDLTQRDGRKRLEEIRGDVRAGTFEKWLELVFLPLFGKETGASRSEFAEQVLRFESELYHSGKISVRLLAATLILSNKLIDKERLEAIWEEIKMLDILEIAEEKGIEKGKALGIQEGKIMGILEDRREMVVDTLIERFNVISARLLDQIRAMKNPDMLKMLHRQALKCQNAGEFEAVMQQVL